MTQIIGYTENNLETVELYVKKTFTTVTKTYVINPNAPLRTIMEYILNNAKNDFQMDQNEIKELLEAGQCIPNVKSEDAPALELDYPDETFKQRFGNSYQCIAFYIRKAN